jgi:mannitol/fructose-specific phosphotransferase system IIA component (Ntr-type)
VKLGLGGDTKEEIVEELVSLLADTHQVADADVVYEAVMNRESQGSTGLEKGVAIPHAKSDAVKKLSVVVGISREGVDFGSRDGRTAHLFFLLVAPTSESGPYVQAIAKIVKMMKLGTFVKKLVDAKAPDEVVDAISRVENGEDVG